MKFLKRFLALALVIVSVLSIAVPAFAATMYVNCPEGETVRIRKTPSTSGRILANLPRGTKVDATSYNSTWHSVSYNGMDGYMMSSFLSSTKPTAASDLLYSFAAQPFHKVTAA